MTVQKILVVEDDPITAKLTARLLQRAGYEVTVAHDAPEALTFIAEQRPDLIILDVMLPSMNGYEICRMLRSEADMKQLPILMFTALDRPGEQRQGFQAGADAYLTKPVHSQELLNQVRSLLLGNLVI